MRIFLFVVTLMLPLFVRATGMSQEAAQIAFSMLLISFLTVIHFVFVSVVLFKNLHQSKKYISSSVVLSMLTILSATGLGWPNANDLGGIVFTVSSYFIPVALSSVLLVKYKCANA